MFFCRAHDNVVFLGICLGATGVKKKKLNVLRRFIFVNLDELLQIVTFANKYKLKK